MLLSKLLNNIVVGEFPDVEITGITNDSRAVRSGYLFLAYPGEKSDGRNYIKQAIENGAAFVLSDGLLSEVENQGRYSRILDGVGIFSLENLSHIQSEIAARFYDHPSKKMNVIGVTGTNGKTSITHFISQSLSYLQKKSGLIGTVGTGFLPHLDKAALTTPDPILLQKLFFDLHQKGAETVAMEVSSHALAQARVSAVDFDIAVFTQLSRDHLDYHQTMENYGNAKAKLFDFPSLKYAVLNWDDEWGRKIAHRHVKDYPILVYSLNSAEGPKEIPALIAKKIEPSLQGFLVSVSSPWGEGQFHCSLMGRFNISNVLATIAALVANGIDFARALESVASLSTVRGRMQSIQKENSPVVVVDYSHTPDALMKALEALREHCAGKLYCVFGCGGDRDSGKRVSMGEIAEKYADFCIITNDNPRSEDPQQIAEAILQGFHQRNKVKLILDRSDAIQFAIDNAKEGDMILLAGKGHEEYQIIGSQTRPFSDIEEARKGLEKKVQA